jgi:DNA-binding Xre family transcriptional regulator
MTARQQRSAAIVAELYNLWEMELPRISGKSKLAEAVRYGTSRRKVLECFLIDGRVENLARADAPAHRQRLAHLPDRKTHAVELQGLNGLCLALTVEIDSNIVERAIRPQTITRKNALFCGAAGLCACSEAGQGDYAVPGGVLLAPGRITMRKADGWQDLTTKTVLTKKRSSKLSAVGSRKRVSI